jgi:hypothetical protein
MVTVEIDIRFESPAFIPEYLKWKLRSDIEKLVSSILLEGGMKIANFGMVIKESSYIGKEVK